MPNVQSRIEMKLRARFEPTYLQVVNESDQHSVPVNSETHFKVTLVSDQFAAKRPVARHQMVYAVLTEEMAGPVHALALHTYTQAEWSGQAPDSPACRGGSKQA